MSTGVAPRAQVTESEEQLQNEIQPPWQTLIQKMDRLQNEVERLKRKEKPTGTPTRTKKKKAPVNRNITKHIRRHWHKICDEQAPLVHTQAHERTPVNI